MIPPLHGPLRFLLRETIPALALASLVLAPIAPAPGDDGTTPPRAQPVPIAQPVPVAIPVAVPTASPVAAPVTQPPPPVVAQPSPLLPPTALSSDDFNRINASARGLAGEKAIGGGAAPWEATPQWKDYSQSLDEKWTYLDRVRLTAMRTWGNTELAGLRSETGTVFYPFSGPDVLYADTLFPNSKVLLMAGLEPVGTMPNLAQLQQNGKLGPYLAEIKTSLFTILAASFFKTKDMKTDFNNQLVDGLMSAMVVFLAREGDSINSVEYVSLDHDGVLHARGDKAGAPGVQITYGDGRTLLYFQADLGNDGLKSNPGFVRLMQRLAPGVTYLKAASYLLYEGYFSTIRDAILDDSVGVVEDDSGIPLHDFDPARWTVVPYGNYTGPIKLFKERNQPDLTALYAATPHPPLPFGSGYKFNSSESSLLVAKRNGAAKHN